MTTRLWFGPAGAEPIGISPSGVPVVADADGAGEMIEVTRLFKAADLQPQWWQLRATGRISTDQEGEDG